MKPYVYRRDILGPEKTRTSWGPPEVGRLIVYRQTVWRVEGIVEVTELDDAERELWLEAGMPDLASWICRPYRLSVTYVGGRRPTGLKDEDRIAGVDAVQTFSVKVKARPRYRPWGWHVYAGERWPMCSCCGEPMPCDAEIEDQMVAAQAYELAQVEAKMPGACWACNEPITSRQKFVEYPGDNLDLPGAESPRFHQRAKCWWAATKYELRWIAIDPRHPRILTYPECGGWLIVHHDGSSECVDRSTGATGRLFRAPEPDCRGHDTHDHAGHAACYTDRCDRDCPREGHPGASPRKRRPRDPLLVLHRGEEQDPPTVA